MHKNNRPGEEGPTKTIPREAYKEWTYANDNILQRSNIKHSLSEGNDMVQKLHCTRQEELWVDHTRVVGENLSYTWTQYAKAGLKQGLVV